MVSSNDAEEVAVARRSSVWTEIQRDRALRQRQSHRAERVHLKVERELKADAARSRTAEDRQAKALEKERIEAEHQAALAAAAEQTRGSQRGSMSLRTCCAPVSVILRWR